MAVFLSSEWIAELDAAVAASSLPPATQGQRITIEQRITDTPTASEVTFHLVIAADGAHVAEGPAAAPDVTVTTDYETARALHEGRTTALHALISGRYKIRGRLTSLRLLSELDDTFVAVRRRTTFP
jgi:hypothetical protein